MEYYGRRNRRGRPRCGASNPQTPMHIIHRPPVCSAYSGFCSFLLMSSLIAVIYLMLDYHCSICTKKYDLYNITKNMDDIAQNISKLKESYTDIEKTIMTFSQDLPKMEGQIEILEALANTMERGDFVWHPKSHLPPPNVGVFLNEPKTATSQKINLMENVTEKYKNFKTAPGG